MKRACNAGGAYNVFKNSTSAMSKNNETTAMLMSQKSPVGFKPFSYFNGLLFRYISIYSFFSRE